MSIADNIIMLTANMTGRTLPPYSKSYSPRKGTFLYITQEETKKVDKREKKYRDGE